MSAKVTIGIDKYLKSQAELVGINWKSTLETAIMAQIDGQQKDIMMIKNRINKIDDDIRKLKEERAVLMVQMQQMDEKEFDGKVKQMEEWQATGAMEDII